MREFVKKAWKFVKEKAWKYVKETIYVVAGLITIYMFFAG